MVSYILDEVFHVLYSQPCPELCFSRPTFESKAGRSIILLTANVSDFELCAEVITFSCELARTLHQKDMAPACGVGDVRCFKRFITNPQAGLFQR
jgi:hypothetical protein